MLTPFKLRELAHAERRRRRGQAQEQQQLRELELRHDDIDNIIYEPQPLPTP